MKKVKLFALIIMLITILSLIILPFVSFGQNFPDKECSQPDTSIQNTLVTNSLRYIKDTASKYVWKIIGNLKYTDSNVFFTTRLSYDSIGEVYFHKKIYGTFEHINERHEFTKLSGYRLDKISHPFGSNKITIIPEKYFCLLNGNYYEVDKKNVFNFVSKNQYSK